MNKTVFEILQNISQALYERLEAWIQEQGSSTPFNLKKNDIIWSKPKHAFQGDYSTSAVMILSKRWATAPKIISQIFLEVLKKNHALEEVVLVAPGFINIFWTQDVLHANLSFILEHDHQYGRCVQIMMDPNPILIEFVSTNPTGPLHVGHGRVAVFGDVLMRLLRFAGHTVIGEYYINDAGGQVNHLASGVLWHYKKLLGYEETVIGAYPADAYPGDYVKEIAESLLLQKKDIYALMSELQDPRFQEIIAFSVEAMMTCIREDMALLGVTHDVFSSERALYAKGTVQEACERLKKHQCVHKGILPPPQDILEKDYIPHELTLFSWVDSATGESRETPLTKHTGEPTYVMGDIGYHWDKWNRGFHTFINIWGADHDDHKKRLMAAVDILTDHQASLTIILCQMVHILQKGQKIKISKRQGTFIPIKSIIEMIGKDSFRFMMLLQPPETHMNLDIDLVQEASAENPVFYLQYAYARICSVLRHGEKLMHMNAVPTDWKRLSLIMSSLVKELADWPRRVLSAIQSHAPHQIAHYLMDVAKIFHHLWQKGHQDAQYRFLQEQDLVLSQTHRDLLRAVKIVMGHGFHILGITLSETLTRTHPEEKNSDNEIE